METKGWLFGWKNIAGFIGCNNRTAKKYHYDFSMPILRGPNGTVIALPEEITAWLIEFNRKCTKKTLVRASNFTKKYLDCQLDKLPDGSKS